MPQHHPEDRQAIWDRCHTALQELLRAINKTPADDPWQMAIEIEELVRLGMSRTDLRLLTSGGDLRDQRELQSKEMSRKFARASRWDDHTCFILTEQGLAFANSLPARIVKPNWNQETRELRVKDELIKRYRVPASNQEVILTVFEEETWPARIDDPLPPTRNMDPKQRLRETIKSLNQNHVTQSRLRFRSDGKGLGIRWDMAILSPTSPPS